MPVALKYAIKSDQGLVRANNQDSGYAGSRLLAVADGMGGHAGGDVASTIVINKISTLDSSKKHKGRTPEESLDRLAAYIYEANRELSRRVKIEPALGGMGTTVTAMVLNGDTFGLAHIGDSRAYCLHEGTLDQVSTDHTFVQRLVEEGRITPEEAHVHPQRSVLMRVLGDVDVDPDLDLMTMPAVPGDRWLICSDGLSGMVSDETIQEILSSQDDPERCVDRLIRLALRAGGTDNITCVVADVVDSKGPYSTFRKTVGAAASSRKMRANVAGAAGKAALLFGKKEPKNDEKSFGKDIPGYPATAEDSPRQQLDHATEPLDEFSADSTGTENVSDESVATSPDAITATVDSGVSYTTEETDQEGTVSEKPRHGKKSRKALFWTLGVVVLLAILAAVGLSLYHWTQQKYFLAPAEDKVAIYRGLPDDLGAVSLSSVYRVSDVKLSDLSTIDRRRVEDKIPVQSLADAERILRTLDHSSSATSSRSPTPTPTPTPTSSSSGERTPQALPAVSTAGSGRLSPLAQNFTSWTVTYV